MAEGRDLKISILSDIEAFDTDPAAADLESLGDSARKAADQIKDNEAAAESAERALDGVGDSAKDASSDLERVGDSAKEAGDETRDAARDIERAAEDTEQSLESIGDAAKDSARETERALDDGKQSVDDYGDRTEDTARKVDSAFEKIARSSRSNMRKVDDDLDRAKRGMDDFKNEAGETGREAAASFSGGFDDIVDGVQELSANAFGGFGAAGAAAGLAVAAGIGIGINALQKAADKANETKQRIIDLSNEMRDAGGSLRDSDVVEYLQDWSDEIADNKEWWEFWQESNTTNLEKVQDAAEDTGISVEDMFKAMSGMDADAATKVIGRLEEKVRDLQEELDNTDYSGYMANHDDARRLIEQEINTTEDYIDTIREEHGLVEKSTELAKLEAEATAEAVRAAEKEAAAEERVKETVEALTEAREESSDIQDEFIDAQQAYTDAVEESADKHEVSVDKIIANLQEQQESYSNWADNIGQLARRGVEEGVLAQLARLGPEGAPMVAALTGASDEELSQWVGLMQGKGTEGADTLIQSLVDGQPGMNLAGKGMGDSAVGGFGSKRDDMRRQAQGMRGDIQSEFNQPIVVDVIANGPSRQQLWAIRSTISNNIGTITVPVAPGTLRAAYRNRS